MFDRIQRALKYFNRGTSPISLLDLEHVGYKYMLHRNSLVRTLMSVICFMFLRGVFYTRRWSALHEQLTAPKTVKKLMGAFVSVQPRLQTGARSAFESRQNRVFCAFDSIKF